MRLVISPPSRAILERKSEHLGVDEGIVLTDCRDLLIVLDVVDIFPEPFVHFSSSMLKRKKLLRCDISRFESA